MKALFIIHCQDPIYGASRSISSLIRSYPGDVDIIFPLNTTRKISKEQVRQFYGEQVRRVWFLPQPIRYTCLEDHIAPIHRIKTFVKTILYAFALPYYRHIYKTGGYDFIHLNSVTLYPMLCRRWPMLIHVRCALRRKMTFWDRHFVDRMNQALGIIYIGEAYKKPAPPLRVPDCILLNPFNKLSVADVDVPHARKIFALNGQETVYAMLGTISQAKGVHFVISAFAKAALENAVLLIAGIDTVGGDYERQAKALAQGNPSIRFVGEMEDTDALYRVTDYVVRAEAVAVAGRTVYEGLYSGCGVIMQGERERDLAGLALPEELGNKVHFYAVRDENDFMRVLHETNGNKMAVRTFRSNAEMYCEGFLSFVSLCKPANKKSSLNSEK